MLLPADFRAEAADELVETFRRSHALTKSRGPLVRLLFWPRTAADVAVTAIAEHLAIGARTRQPVAFTPRDLMKLLTDLPLALRSLRKNAGFTVPAMLTLVLGIGATTAIFSVVNAVLLEPLPYRDPSRLVLVWQELRARGVQEFPFPIGDIPDLREKGTLLEDVATVNTARITIATEGSEPEQVRSAVVTTNMFRLLGLRVLHGRDFETADGAPLSLPATGAAGQAAPVPPPPPPAAVLSYEYWQRSHGSNTAVIGRILPLAGGGQVRIVGVLAPGAQLLFAPRNSVERVPDLWVAARIDFANGSRTAGAVRVIGRLQPGVSVEQAQAQMETLAAELRSTYPVKQNAGVYINVVSMHDSLVSDVRPAIVALMGAVTFVLLIACANVANLLIAQAARREQDLAVRAALGATRSELVRQMLAECALLAGIGAMGGVILAHLGIALLQQIGPASLPRLQSVAIDWRVLAFSGLAAIGSAALFGFMPALRASRPNVVDVLRRTGRTVGLGAGRLRAGLVVVEVALSFVLLVGSGLMLRSMNALQHVDPGFDPRGVLTFYMPNIPIQGQEARVAFVSGVTTELMALPGVQHVSGANPLPLAGGTANMPWGTEAAAADPTLFQQAAVHTVRPGYFETLRVTVLEGRVFTDDDNRSGVPGIVVDRLLAAKAYPGQPAVGKRLLLRVGGNAPTPFEIIGVVAHQRHATLAADGREAIFFTEQQQGAAGIANRWIVRATGDLAAIAGAVKAAVARVDSRVAVSEIEPMQALVDRALAPTRFALVLTSIFAAIAAVLAVVGLYGVLSTSVRQRTAEIGVRMAFGAERSSIFRLIVGRGLVLSSIGIAIGAASAFGLTRWISSLLVGVRATDPVTFIAIGSIFLAVSALACGLPAYRASRLDATTALRSE